MSRTRAKTRWQVFTLVWVAPHLSVVRVALEPQVGVQAVGPHGTARLDSLRDEAVQTGLGDIGNASQPDETDLRAVFLALHRRSLTPSPKFDRDQILGCDHSK